VAWALPKSSSEEKKVEKEDAALGEAPKPREMMTRPFAIRLMSAALLFGACSTSGGCSARARAGIPVEAERVAEAKGELVYQVPAGGEAYILDVSDNKIVWSGHLREGETLTIQPEADRVAVDLQSVAEPDLNQNHRFTVYLRRD
jgi:hypothetical protein